ncbi:MAG: hypothetical protein GON13_01560 [Nanoarchaeota archaeon]|nr:hypothetical protein [Nanoarchaeota archaeon]
MKFYNNKKKKELETRVEQTWGAKIKVNEIIEGGKNKLWHVSEDVKKIRTRNLRIETMGTYFARYDKRGELRLSIEGSMKVGPYATKYIVRITEKEMNEWIRGINLDKKTENKGYVILKYENNYVGCGKSYSEGILNHVPKNRRIKNL